MLNKDEELRLASILGVIENDTAEGIMYVCNEQTMKWLAEKLKECNDANYQIMEELQKTNEEVARLREHYKG